MAALPPAVDVLPPEVRALLAPLERAAQAGSAASARARDRLVGLSHLMDLPVPPALREAAPGLLAAAARAAEVADDAARSDAAAAFERALAEAEARARAQALADAHALRA